MPGFNRFICRGVCAAGLGVLGSCATYEPSVPPSQGHITAPEAPVKDIPPTVKTPAFVPPPKPVEKLPTYSVVVTDVPAKELLFALARDTKTNIDVHPNIQGLVTLNAINETLPAILDRIARQIDMRYRKEANTLIVEPDAPYFRTYRINYLNLERQTKSVNSVATQVSSTGGGVTATPGGAGPPGGAGGTSAGNTSSTTVESESRNSFFSVLERNIQTILASTRALKQSADQRAAQSEALRQAREERVQQVEAASRAGAAAPALLNSAGFNQPLSTIPADVINEVSVNPLSGTVSVLATERQHQLIQQHIDTIMNAVTRQVLIEATIVEIRLFNNYQAGVDFSLLADGGGFNIVQQLFQGSLDNNPVSIGYADPDAGIGNINVAIKFLEQFGKARVLSSPRLMALNNQTALLKVVDNRVYFTIESQISQAAIGGSTLQSFTTTVNTVPVGLVMFVTPQIDENKSVILNVRPTVSRIISFARDPNPSLPPGVTNLIPEIQAREIESVLRVGSGQTVILGGLMQDDVRRDRDGIPFLAKQPSPIGDIFSFRDEAVSKTELVIFLRPIVILNPSLESDELKFFQRYLPNSSNSAP